MLTDDKKRLVIFEQGLIINKSLPKWKNRTSAKSDSQTESSTTYTFSDSSMPEYGPKKDLMKIDFDDVAKLAIDNLTNFINDFGPDAIFGPSWLPLTNLFADHEVRINGQAKEKKSIFKTVSNLLKKEKKEKNDVQFSVLDFFSIIKKVSKESADTYKDRVLKYLAAIHNAKKTGQSALIEKLAREMLANKYEAELYANGLYYAVTEQQVVDFAKKTEKGLALIYLTNFARPLPEEVVNKIDEINSLYVFDNYAVLTYDPNGECYLETEEEKQKRKDPILFGLISGSNKLYYITDWVDDVCDLTLEQFVDTLGIKKEELKMK